MKKCGGERKRAVSEAATPLLRCCDWVVGKILCNLVVDLI